MCPGHNTPNPNPESGPGPGLGGERTAFIAVFCGRDCQPGSTGNRTRTWRSGPAQQDEPSFLESPHLPVEGALWSAGTHRHGQDASAPADPHLPQSAHPHRGETSQAHFSRTSTPCRQLWAEQPNLQHQGLLSRPHPGQRERAGLTQPGILWLSQPRGTSVQGALGALASPSGLKGSTRRLSRARRFYRGLAGRKWAQVTQASSPTSSACECPEDPGQLLPDPGRQEHDGRQPGLTPQFLNFQRAPP